VAVSCWPALELPADYGTNNWLALELPSNYGSQLLASTRTAIRLWQPAVGKH